MYSKTPGIPFQAIERLYAPYNYEADIRLIRLGVLNADRTFNNEGIQSLCVVMGANLYDNICEYGEDVTAFHSQLVDLYGEEDIVGAYLCLCVQYALMGEEVPEQIQWVAYNNEALEKFIELFVLYQHSYMLEDDLIVEEDADPTIDVVLIISESNGG
jgi:hypothetical protein